MPEEPLIRVMALHALSYCERLFFLEEVEEIRVADERVFAGRRLHARLEKDRDDPFQSLTLASETLGIQGKVDCIRRRDGRWIPYEHKRGRPQRNDAGEPIAWPSDRLQLGAYSLLLEEALGESVPEARLRYHAQNAVVTINIDDTLRQEVNEAIHRARQLRRSLERPDITEESRRCIRCSLSPVCLPEEARLLRGEINQPKRLFPPDDTRRILHITQDGAYIGKDGKQLKLRQRTEGAERRWPVRQVKALVLHGFAQISTQALRFCGEQSVSVHWLTTGGRYVGSYCPARAAVQRKIRQYQALTDIGTTLSLSRKLVEARIAGQLAALRRGTRGKHTRSPQASAAIKALRDTIPNVRAAERRETLLGLEGQAAARYFQTLPELVKSQPMKPQGRSRRPPKDRFNALLSFGYALLLADVTAAIMTVGLEPALGFYHQPRSAAPPLALDLMELFRVPIVDLAVIAAVNRNTFHPEQDFVRAGQQVWLSDDGRRKLLTVYERRKADTWFHPGTAYSLTYARHIELEVRLLEKEWMGEGGLFASVRIR